MSIYTRRKFAGFIANPDVKYLLDDKNRATLVAVDSKSLVVILSTRYEGVKRLYKYTITGRALYGSCPITHVLTEKI